MKSESRKNFPITVKSIFLTSQDDHWPCWITEYQTLTEPKKVYLCNQVTEST